MTLCPRCEQPLPETPERFCIHCGAPLDGEAVSSPADPQPDAQPSVPPPADTALPEPSAELPPPPDSAPTGAPWDRRSEVGLVTALVDTTLQVLSKPRAFFGRMAVDGGLGGPLAYGVLLGYVGLLASAVYDTIFESIVGRQSPQLGLGPEFERAVAMLQGGPGLLVQAIVGPVAIAVSLLLVAALNHLGLMLLGGARRDFEATFRVCSYAKATSLIALVPVCGPLIGVVWGAVVTIIGLQTVHDTTLARAVGAVLLPFVVVCCCCAGTLGLMAALMASAVQ